ncbi:hypothetical protein QOZ80_6BG0491060 [Eleusine coracana subsp. coracana]|nr:hypothetical protein QOZ80_6BG0491060 [Eleusine coracana subsp. coracana]
MVHNVLIGLASSSDSDPAPRIEGAILLHPWFGGNALVEGEDEVKAKGMATIWEFACPGADEPDGAGRAGAGEPSVRADARVRRRGGLGNAQGPGVLRRLVDERAAWIESDGEGHVFFLEKPECEKAKELMDRVVSFIAGS